MVNKIYITFFSSNLNQKYEFYIYFASCLFMPVMQVIRQNKKLNCNVALSDQP